MINRIKRKIPNILSTNGHIWTSKLMSYVNSGVPIPEGIIKNYKHSQIKFELNLETEEKCIYCETYITHQYPGDVEHIIPKSIYPRLTFTWNNLSFVCYKCNNNKRATLDKLCKLLNPYKDCIDDHLKAYGPIIFQINDSKRGEITLKEIDLNRKELIERRVESLKNLQNLIDKYNRESVLGLKQILKNEIIEFSKSDKEFSMCNTQFLKENGII